MITFRRLLGLLKSSSRLVVLAVGLGWATTISWFALISTSAYLISFAALQPSIAELQVAIVGVRFFGISRAVFRYSERLVSHTVTFDLLARLRTWLYERIEPLAPGGLELDSSGDLLTRLVSDVETLQDFYVRTVAPPLIALLSSIGILWFFGRWSVWLAVVLFGFQLLTGILLPLLVRQMAKSKGRQLTGLRASISNLVVDGVQGFPEILIFDLKSRIMDRLRVLNGEVQELESQQIRIRGGHEALASLLTNLTVVLLLLVAVPIVRSGHLDGRLLAVVILGAIASFEAILPLPQAFQNTDECLAAGKHIFELADRIPPVESGEMTVTDSSKIDLEFKNLSFAYRHGGMLVLNELNLKIPAGGKVAILGPSGVGKSTITDLLLGFRRSIEGEILVNGKSIAQIDLEGMRELISYVPQNPFLFNASVLENIRIGNPDATREMVEESAMIAGLQSFIETLPDRFETNVGEYGMLMSGGQRQRLALARALLRDTPIYLFDEPTANLDKFAEQEVIDRILNRVADKSLIWITHRVVGLALLDEIVVLANGKVVERGSHDDLIQAGGRYARIVQLEQDGIDL
jgi:ATP-binding cassette subfamily C protein CydC